MRKPNTLHKFLSQVFSQGHFDIACVIAIASNYEINYFHNCHQLANLPYDLQTFHKLLENVSQLIAVFNLPPKLNYSQLSTFRDVWLKVYNNKANCPKNIDPQVFWSHLDNYPQKRKKIISDLLAYPLDDQRMIMRLLDYMPEIIPDIKCSYNSSLFILPSLLERGANPQYALETVLRYISNGHKVCIQIWITYITTCHEYGAIVNDECHILLATYMQNIYSFNRENIHLIIQTLVNIGFNLLAVDCCRLDGKTIINTIYDISSRFNDKHIVKLLDNYRIIYYISDYQLAETYFHLLPPELLHIITAQLLNE